MFLLDLCFVLEKFGVLLLFDDFNEFFWKCWEEVGFDGLCNFGLSMFLDNCCCLFMLCLKWGLGILCFWDFFFLFVLCWFDCFFNGVFWWFGVWEYFVIFVIFFCVFGVSVKLLCMINFLLDLEKFGLILFCDDFVSLIW